MYCLQIMSMTAYLSDLKCVPTICLAEARAERQMAEVEERQRKLADLAESALTEVNLNQHALLLDRSTSCGMISTSLMGIHSEISVIELASGVACMLCLYLVVYLVNPDACQLGHKPHQYAQCRRV